MVVLECLSASDARKRRDIGLTLPRGVTRAVNAEHGDVAVSIQAIFPASVRFKMSSQSVIWWEESVLETFESGSLSSLVT